VGHEKEVKESARSDTQMSKAKKDPVEVTKRDESVDTKSPKVADVSKPQVASPTNDA
jgi:hypothetical protein